MALPAPKSPNKHQDIITEAREKYGEVITAAQLSVETTNTEGWRNMYAEFRRAEKSERKIIADVLRQKADQLDSYMLTEDDEKDINEVKKRSQDLRQRSTSFAIQTLDPIRQPVMDAEKVIAESKRVAETAEQQAPLHNVGLRDLMSMEIAKWHTVRWISETGQVVVEDPKL